MKIILTVVKKELKDTLRDRRTLLTAILMPAIVFPLMFLGMTKIEAKRTEDAQNKILKVGVINAPEIVKSELKSDKKIALKQLDNEEKGKKQVEKNNLDAVIAFGKNDGSSNELNPVSLTVYHKSVEAVAYARLMQKIAVAEKLIVQKRIEMHKMNPVILTPFSTKTVDLVSKFEELNAVVGIIFPIVFILFCFIGCMYPAIDLITGEKEKRTIETLLTVPSSRFEILIGKMITIALIGLLSALLTIIGVFVSISFFGGSEMDISSNITEIISLKSVLMLIGMLVPLSIFFAGLLVALVVRTKSFKESQSVVTPLTFVMIVPAIMAISPGAKLNWENVWIPVYNMALAIKEIMAGSISIAHYAVIMCSLFIAALMAALMSFKQFSDENMIVNQ